MRSPLGGTHTPERVVQAIDHFHLQVAPSCGRGKLEPFEEFVRNVI